MFCYDIFQVKPVVSLSLSHSLALSPIYAIIGYCFLFLDLLALNYSRYALSKGAAAFAVDIEETEHHSEPRSFGSSIKVSQHHIQRRSEAICQERGEPTGNF